jgi:hypothetical protein
MGMDTLGVLDYSQSEPLHFSAHKKIGTLQKNTISED